VCFCILLHYVAAFYSRNKNSFIHSKLSLMAGYAHHPIYMFWSAT